mmetsp:Transcript_14825/g.47289  ORF Transcript_14825/g.47289 Transcript_14825/m.47289 type:complete len:254 (-) Transcript_14825:758-1519(-)
MEGSRICCSASSSSTHAPSRASHTRPDSNLFSSERLLNSRSTCALRPSGTSPPPAPNRPPSQMASAAAWARAWTSASRPSSVGSATFARASACARAALSITSRLKLSTTLPAEGISPLLSASTERFMRSARAAPVAMAPATILGRHIPVTMPLSCSRCLTYRPSRSASPRSQSLVRCRCGCTSPKAVELRLMASRDLRMRFTFSMSLSWYGFFTGCNASRTISCTVEPSRKSRWMSHRRRPGSKGAPRPAARL